MVCELKTRLVDAYSVTGPRLPLVTVNVGLAHDVVGQCDCSITSVAETWPP
jgi:hypothetical protein